MKTKKFLGCVAALAMTLHTSAQVAWDTDGNSVTGTEWFGADAGSTLPLRIETRANQPIEWYTDAVRRMVLSPTQSPTINGFTVPTDGFLGLSGHTNFFIGDGPFSRLHLADNSNAAIINAQQFAFRPWQRNGVTFTGNADHGYLGQEHNGNDTTDMVLLWSNDFGVDQFAPDHFSIRFLSRYGAATTGANSMRGLEAMRFFAVDPDRVNVGIGDYIAGAILDPQVSEPTEILDVLDGRVRIRALPEAAGEADGTYKVMVVDDTPSPSGERGVVKWVDPNDLPGGSSGGGADCDWDITPSANRITTAWRPFGTNGNCPEEDWKLGVGTNNPSAKLHVFRTAGETGATISLYTRANTTQGVTGSGVVSALDAEGTHYGTNPETYAVRATQYLHGESTTGEAYGVRSLVQPYGNADVDVMYGLHTRVNGTPTSARYAVYAHSPASSSYQSWAGWFAGNVHATGVVTWGSDAGLKSDIEPLTNANEVLQALHPKRYRFQVDAYPHLGLPEGERLGLIAQEVQDVLPNLVVPTRQPAIRDEEGQVIAEAHEYLSLNYIEIVPLLIAGYQEQQQALEEMRDQLGAMQEQLALCCSNPDRSESPLAPEGDLKLDPATERLLRIDPNPFTDRTTIRYTLERGGRTMLLVNSSDGKQLQVLQEAVQQAGEYQQEWHTDHLAPGVYYVTLLLDGEPLVKRAVKVN